ncbi:oligosaccharide flippase family protein [Candidatus Dojkabacteria bacterium]|uniref:Oligosaccharide flippase family protein n=1 Tax=Candidatus Dojkabacteria bacterium TaxID=2099670 RepID=A0A955LBN5_9BACT|nr:oligosaccharide flippase family protein [Candidatus Dojkabacteria bacterium]
MKVLINFIPGIARLFAAIVPILLLFFYTKTASLEQVGLVGYFISLITILGVLTDFGLPEAAQRFIPQSNNKKETIGQILFTEIIVVVLGMLLFTVSDVISDGEISKGYFAMLLIVFFFSISNVVLVIFNGLNYKNRLTAYFFASAVTFFAISAITFLFFDFSAVNSFFIGRLISWVIFTILPLVDLYRLNLLAFSFNIPKKFLKFAFNIFTASFAYVLFTQWDSIVVTQLGSAKENGIYKPVEFLASLPLALRVILETKLLPEFSEIEGKGDFLTLKNKTLFYTKALSALSIIVTIIAIPFTHFGLSIFYNTEIADEGSLIFVLTLIGTFLYILSIPATTALQALNKEHKIRNAATVQSAIFLIFATILFIPLGTVFLPILLVITCGGYFAYTFASVLSIFTEKLK